MERAPADRSLRPVVAPAPRAPVAPLARRPTFAVAIAAYQAADTVAEAIESVLAQTLPADEIVVVDDGSTDATDAAIEPYRDRVTAIRKRNGGEASAKNAAAYAATSDFVVILDADDLYEPERLEAIAELATARPDLDVITTDVAAELDGRVLSSQGELHAFPADAEAQRAEILRHSFLSCPAIRRAPFVAIGGFDETLSIGTDWHCWIRLILGGALVGLVDEPLYRYRFTAGSLASDPLKNHRADVAILERIREHPQLRPHERPIVEQGIRNHRREVALLEARRAIRDGRAGEARLAALRVALGHGIPLRSRAKAGVSALSPALSRRLLERRETGEAVDVAHR